MITLEYLFNRYIVLTISLMSISKEVINGVKTLVKYLLHGNPYLLYYLKIHLLLCNNRSVSVSHNASIS